MECSQQNDQPAKKRQRLSDCVNGETDGVEPMVLANGNVGSLHRPEDDRVGPRKLIPRCRPRRSGMMLLARHCSLLLRLYRSRRWRMLDKPWSSV